MISRTGQLIIFFVICAFFASYHGKRQIPRLPLNLMPLLWVAWFPAVFGNLLCPGHQLIQFCRIYISFLVTTILRQFCEDMPEVIVRVLIVQLCHLRNTVNKSTSPGSPCCVMEHPFFLQPIQKVRIARSEAELAVGIFPSFRNTFKYFS